MIEKLVIEKINEIENAINDKGRFDNLSLMKGSSGCIVFYSNLFQYQNEEIYLSKIEQLIADSIDDLNKGYNLTSLSYGIPGFAWTLEYLSLMGVIDIKEISFLDDIDTFMYKNMMKGINAGDYDFLNSSGGIFWYFLNKKAINKEYIGTYIDVLYSKAKNIDSDKIAWIVIEQSRGRGKDEEYNLSISHGLSSLIILLAKANMLGIRKSKTKELLEKSLNFLYSQEYNNSNNRFLFPDYIDSSNMKYGGGRLAWCYGDLGIAIALWQAGDALNDKKLKQKASDICLNTTKIRKYEDAGVLDAGLCHGTAGIAHIYNRMYRYTNNPEFKKAANYWIEETLKIATFADGLAGFKVYRTAEYGGYVNEYSLLQGVSGIGLSLLSYVNEKDDPTWDKCLLLS